MDGSSFEVGDVADKLGMTRQGARQLQCPRSRCNGDEKPSVAVFSDGQHWRCVRCSARGNALDYAAFATLGEVPAENSSRWETVLARLDGRPASATGKPAASGGTRALPHPDDAWGAGFSSRRQGKVLYFEAPRTPFSPIPFRRRDGRRGS